MTITGVCLSESGSQARMVPPNGLRAAVIIPAHGGSKGIPRKNIQPVCGKPLIGWSLEAAHRAKTIERVFVSTDDAEIAAVARQFSAEVIPRPAEISGDTVSSESALLHGLEFLEKQEGYVPDLLVFLQCTSPLMLPEDIDGTVAKLVAEKADTAMTVAPFCFFLWQLDAAGEAAEINHDKRVRPWRQDRAAQYRETGAVYVMRTSGFKEHKHRFFGKTVMHVVPEMRSAEIDDPMDLRVIETLLQVSQHA